MVKEVENNTERRRLRKALNEKYRKQADHILSYGVRSEDTEIEIIDLVKELKKVDKNSVGSDRFVTPKLKTPKKKRVRKRPEKPPELRNPKRLKVPWTCSKPDCSKPITAGQEKIMFQKRHYCSQKCAFVHNGIASDEPLKDQDIKKSKGSVRDG